MNTFTSANSSLSTLSLALSSQVSSSWAFAFIGLKSATATRTSPSTSSKAFSRVFMAPLLAQRSISRNISDSWRTSLPWLPLGRTSSSSPLALRRTLSTLFCRVWML
ncbi:hypothetical protein D3C84_521800 [compost metagenome]